MGRRSNQIYSAAHVLQMFPHLGRKPDRQISPTIAVYRTQEVVAEELGSAAAQLAAM